MEQNVRNIHQKKNEIGRHENDITSIFNFFYLACN